MEFTELCLTKNECGIEIWFLSIAQRMFQVMFRKSDLELDWALVGT